MNIEWKPIQDLPVNWDTLVRNDLHALAGVWKERSEL